MDDLKSLRRLAETLRRELAGPDEAKAWRAVVRGMRDKGPASAGGGSRSNGGSVSERVAKLIGQVKGARTALASPFAVSWLYQFWVNADKKRLAARLRERAGDTVGEQDIIAATCVYTSREHARFLLQNSLGRMWLAARPRSALRQSWEWIVPAENGGASCSIEDLTVLDPACGTGHLLVEALEMLFAIYQEEYPRWTAQQACRQILGRHLFGLDVDRRAVSIARSLIAAACQRLCGEAMRARHVVCVSGMGGLRRPRGSSLPDRMLRSRYAVVTMNPPYVGFRKLAPPIKQRIVDQDPNAASDMAIAFLSRGFEMVRDGGFLAAVTPSAWLTSQPAQKLRMHMIERGGPRVVAMLGQRVFETAPLLFVSLSIVERGKSDGAVSVIEARGRELMQAAARVVQVPLAKVQRDPRVSFAPIAAVLPVDSSTKFAMTGDFVSFVDGVWTGDNARDTRNRTDVGTGDPEWFPAAGGLGHCRWYGPVVRMLRANAALRWPHVERRVGCLEYSRVAGGKLAARMVLERSAAIAGVVSMFLKEGVEDRRLDVLAVFNSRVGTLWLRALTSGLNFNPGYAARVPLPADGFGPRVRELVQEAVELKRRKASGEAVEGLAEIEMEIDQRVAEAMGVRESDLSEVTLPRG